MEEVRTFYSDMHAKSVTNPDYEEIISVLGPVAITKTKLELEQA